MVGKLRTHPERPGVVVLMALLFMSAVTASTVGIGLVISSSLKQSRSIDDYITASLAADSGLERGLGVISATHQTSSLNLTDALACISTTNPACPNRGGVPATLANGATVNVRSSESYDPVTKKSLADGESLSFDLLNLNNTGATFPKYIKVQGDCLESPCDNILEVSWNLIDQTGTNAYSNRAPLIAAQYDTPLPTCLDLTNVKSETDNAVTPFSGTILGFRVRVRSLNGSVDDVAVTAHTGSTCPNASINPILSRIQIESTGRAGSAQPTRSIKRAQVLWQAPASEIFNYVIFSEQSLIP